MRFYIFILFFGLYTEGVAQNTAITNPLLAIQALPNDTVKVSRYYAVGIDDKQKIAQKIVALRQAYALAQNLNAQDWLPKIETGLMSRYADKGVLDSALYFNKLASQHYEQQGKKKELAQSYLVFLFIFKRQGNFEAANNYAFKALALYEELNDENGITDANGRIGSFFYAQKNYPEALKYATKAYDLAIKINKPFFIAYSTQLLGDIWLELKDYNKALRYQNETVDLRRQQNNSLQLSIALSARANTFNILKRYEEGLKDFEEAVAINRDKGYDEALMYALSDIGTSYSSSGQFDKALPYLLETQKKASENGNRYVLKETYKHLSEAYEGINRFDSAFHFQKLFVQLNDSIFNTETAAKMSELQTKYQTAQKEAKIATQTEELNRQNALVQKGRLELLLRNQQLSIADKEKDIQRLAYLKEKAEKQEKEQALTLSEKEKALQSSELKTLNQAATLQTAELKAKNLQRNLFLICSALLALLLFALYRNYRNQKKSNAILQLRNEEKEFLIKEIHHRVKNNLQVLSSLLHLQSKHIKDDAALDAVREGQNRVEAMGLIHQKLYMGDNLAAVDMPDYLKNLGDTLLDSFGIEDDSIQIQYEVQLLHLDVDTAIPLGLIINELVTNSLKYAFPLSFSKNTEGVINLSLWINEAKQLCLKVSDNGVGKAQPFEGLKPSEGYHKNSTSFGTNLVQILSKKLKGKPEILLQETGYGTLIRFEEYKMVSVSSLP